MSQIRIIVICAAIVFGFGLAGVHLAADGSLAESVVSLFRSKDGGPDRLAVGDSDVKPADADAEVDDNRDVADDSDPSQDSGSANTVPGYDESGNEIPSSGQ